MTQNDDKREIIRTVKDSPYIRRSDLRDEVEVSADDFESALEDLLEEEVLVSLTRQSGSNLESRVPERVYIINPEKESELDLD